MLVSTALLGMTGCSSEDAPEIVNGNDTVTFTAALPGDLGSRTRAFGDGTEALNLYYAVYNQGQTTPIYSNFSSEPEESRQPAVTFTDLKASVTLKLAANQKYDVVMWAQSYTDGDAACPYVFDPEAKTITVDYSKMGVNSETPDAFYAVQEITAPSYNNNPISIKLYRPFAQINIGTNDMEEAKALGFPGLSKSKIQVAKMPNVLNMADGTTSGEVTAYNYSVSQAAAPGEEEIFPVTGHDYISMVYVLAPKGQKMLAGNVTVSITDSNNKSTTLLSNLANIPVQANFRTNIFGSLLLKQSTMNVEIIPTFNGSHQEPQDGNISKWDGTSVSESLEKSEDNAFLIKSAADLVKYEQLVNAEDASVIGADKIVRLETDIDLQGYNWTPIMNKDNHWHIFGTFDGNGHTIYNLNVDSPSGYAGLFGEYKANIRNLTIEGGIVKGGHWTAALVAKTWSGSKPDDANPTGFIDNCTVKNVYIVSTSQDVGAVIGQFQTSLADQVYVTNTHAINCTISTSSTYDVGLFAGSCQYQPAIDFNTCTVTNVAASTTSGAAITKLVGQYH